MTRLRVAVVDDERLARTRLERLLAAEPEVDVVGSCESARAARELVADREVDVMFLDVEMPRVGGFELLAGLPPQAIPAVVFVTAYEQYAVDAFAIRACDYLLKPVSPERLGVAVQRARQWLGQTVLAPADVVLVRTDTKILRIAVDSIDWIEAAGNYVELHVGERAHLLRETIGDFEAKLPPDRFARIHRSTIVNLDRVIEFRPTVSGDFSVTLQTGAQLRMSRTYRARIRDVFGKTL